MRLNYDVHENGWAVLAVEGDGVSHQAHVSYIHDSLSQLAVAADQVLAGAPAVRVTFVDEPGEHCLDLTSDGELVAWSFRWFDDWEDLSLDGPAQRLLASRRGPGSGKVVASGRTSAIAFADEVLRVLDVIYETLGPDGYRDRWVAHNFPEAQRDALRARRITMK